MPKSIPHTFIEGVEYKKCTECLKLKELDYFTKASRAIDGLYYQCKECNSKIRKAKQAKEIKKPYLSKDKHIIVDGIECKVCSKCKRILPTSNRYFNKNGLVSDKLRAECRECAGRKFITIKAGYKLCTRCNRELPMTIKYFREVSPRNNQFSSPCRGCLTVGSKKYRNNNIDKCKELEKAWAIKNHAKVSVYRNRRRSLRRNAIATLTCEEWKECLIYFGNKDAYTGLALSCSTQDHVIPLIKGGYFSKHNIVPCEMSVNSSKNKSDMETWYRKQTYFSEKRLKKIYKWIGYKDGIQQLGLF